MKRSLFNSRFFAQFSDFAPVGYEKIWISLGKALPPHLLSAKTVKRRLSLVLVSLLLVSQSCIKLEEDTSSVLLVDDLSDEGLITAFLTSIYREYQDLIRIPDYHFLTAFGATVQQAMAQRESGEEVALVIEPSAINWKHYIAPIPVTAIISSDLVQNPEGFILK